nr:hypothetical protein Iba_chr04aCG17170 [Ipomoea batatas]
MEISSLARSFPGHSLLPAPNGRNSPTFGAIVSLRKRLCSSKEMPTKDFLPMSSVVEAGHPGLNASSSVRTLRLASDEREKEREYLEANEDVKESGLEDLKALRKGHMLPMKGKPKSPGGKRSLFS